MCACMMISDPTLKYCVDSIFELFNPDKHTRYTDYKYSVDVDWLLLMQYFCSIFQHGTYTQISVDEPDVCGHSRRGVEAGKWEMIAGMF